MSELRLFLRSVYLKGHQDALVKTADMAWEDKIVSDIKQLLIENVNRKRRISHDYVSDGGDDARPCECDDCYKTSIHNQALSDVVKMIGEL